jgi:hypothetical protein
MSQPPTTAYTETCDLTSREEYNQLNRKIDELDEIVKNLSEKLLNNGRDKLDKWRDESYKMINQFYEQKYQELHENCLKKIGKPKDELEQIRLQIYQLIQEEKTNKNDIQLLTSNIQHIKQKLKEIEQKDIQINIQSFLINENLISIENSISDDFDLSLLSSPCHTIHSSNQNSWSIASNNKYLLIDQYPNLYLLDKNLTIVNQYQWKYNHICDICWSTILNKFIIITHNKVCLIDENLTSIEHIRSIKGEKWWSCTCSNSSLYLTSNERDSGLFQFDLSSAFQLIKQWKSSSSDEQGEYIYDITYQHDKLALIIGYTQNRSVYLILRSSTTFDLIWSYQLDINYKWFQTAIRCCSLTNDQWFIIEEYTSHIFHIDKDGKVKQKREYTSQPWNAIVFGTDVLAIRTETSINFHRV